MRRAAPRSGHPSDAALIGVSGAFAAIATILGSPLVAAMFMIEAIGFGGAQLFATMLPGLLCAGIGSVMFTGLGEWTGLRDPDARAPCAARLPAAGHRRRPLGGPAGDPRRPVRLLACVGFGYAISLASFRGGPVFPAVMLGVAFGELLAGLPDLGRTPAIAIVMAALTVSMLRFPVASILRVAILLASTGLGLMPLVILAAVTAFIVTELIDPPPRASSPA